MPSGDRQAAPPSVGRYTPPTCTFTKTARPGRTARSTPYVLGRSAVVQGRAGLGGAICREKESVCLVWERRYGKVLSLQEYQRGNEIAASTVGFAEGRTVVCRFSRAP